jgi:hypothetical protein
MRCEPPGSWGPVGGVAAGRAPAVVCLSCPLALIMLRAQSKQCVCWTSVGMVPQLFYLQMTANRIQEIYFVQGFCSFFLHIIRLQQPSRGRVQA